MLSDSKTDVNALYIHIPFCISKCQYCDFFSVTSLQDNQIPENYIEALCNEINYRLEINKVTELSSIYIGGGTPSLLSKNQISKIITVIENKVSFPQNYEFTIESNPDDVTEDFLLFLKTTKINRISIGIQSFNQKCLSFAKRRADSQQNQKALKLLQTYFPDFSVDFICGLPFENETSFMEGLKNAISYNPKHISMYSLTFEEETPFGKLLDSGKLNYNFDKTDELWIKAREFLDKNGYPQYEVSNFAKKENQCIHNLVYWNHKPYLGCGSGGTGTLYNISGEGFRWTNTKNISLYSNFWNNFQSADKKNLQTIPCNNEKINLKTSSFEFFMMGLRKMDGITSQEYESTFNKPLPDNFVSLAQKWHDKKLMNITNHSAYTRYALNSEGILFLNSFLEALLQPFLL